MTKRLIDIDDADLREAKAALSTRTMKETVQVAFREAAATAARRREIDRLSAGSLSALADKGTREGLWQ